ncbi:rho GTPase-activating protein 17a isoform X4 [Latimeria chalumnae]|uniref:rho GTPase-activating protein 17a isoform X4 n=1 Tax=Latimeria chalumnae TaxID=7897 RepID=UPI00313CDBBE
MKKQFNRMRQLANQTVGRAEKTEVLSDDLLQIEKRLDTVRTVCHHTHKRLQLCLQSQPGTEIDKRQKKLPLTALSQCMQEGCSQLADDSIFSKMLEMCSDAENKMAVEHAIYEMQVERDVLEPLNLLAEIEIPNLQKQRKQLARLVLDWDSARARWNQATKSGANIQALVTKADSLKEEMDEASNKVEQCKDQLAADMYNFISKEGEHAQCFVSLLEAQAEYHRKALAVLEKVLPAIQAQQDSWTEKPAFGTPLEEHLKRSNREIALPIEACVMMLLETGMKEEGLFRIAAGASKLKKLKAALDCSTSQLEEFYFDPHAVAGALKSYLRELPEPLMSFHLYEEWKQATNITDQDTKLQFLWTTCSKLPKPNHANFRYLIKFLAKLSQSSDINKMTPSNIAIVLGPNLLWAKNEGTLAEMAAATSVHVVAIIEPIIQHADWFFPGDQNFDVSGAFVPATPSNNINHLPFGNEYECGTLERKRPVSMAAVEGDFLRKEGTLKPKDPAATPPPVRNGTNVTNMGQSQPQSVSTSSNHLSVGPAQPTTGPSPHMVRRATKKPAPAPPKPTNLPPGQPGGQGSAPTPNQPLNQSPKQPSTSVSPPNPHTTQGSVQSPASAQPAVQPRRHSSNLPPIQAPNHPPPQPPTQATPPLQPKFFGQAHPPPAGAASEQGPERSSPTPPQTPTPPGTPTLGTHSAITNVSQQAHQFQVTTTNQDSPQPQPSPPLQTGTLPRPRPVPKPRNRPCVPPPPQPPTATSAGENPFVTQAQTSSKIITDSNFNVQGQLRTFSPELPVEPAPAAPCNDSNIHQMPDIEHDTESTAL